ncbi:HTH_Tnp_Tc3_2 domain-containing protein [Trichonephila clavipes]|nr:HTH_Tnp_Tc3_2 domain-containing protein [Trichonephila clavipes]
MPRVRSRNAYQLVFDFDKGRIIAYRKCGLSYHSFAACIGRDPMTVSRIWNQRAQDGNRNAVLDLNGSLSLAAEKTGMLPA